MLKNLLLDTAGESAGSGVPNWVLPVVIGVMIVGMILLTVLPNRKRQKEYQKMQNEIRVGTKIMTIGRMVGVITKIYADNTMELDVGTPGKPVIITITREAIGINMTAQEEMKARQEAAKTEKQKPLVQPVVDENADAQTEVTQDGDNSEVTEVVEAEESKASDEDDAI